MNLKGFFNFFLSYLTSKQNKRNIYEAFCSAKAQIVNHSSHCDLLLLDSGVMFSAYQDFSIMWIELLHCRTIHGEGFDQLISSDKFQFPFLLKVLPNFSELESKHLIFSQVSSIIEAYKENIIGMVEALDWLVDWCSCIRSAIKRAGVFSSLEDMSWGGAPLSPLDNISIPVAPNIISPRNITFSGSKRKLDECFIGDDDIDTNELFDY